MTQAIILPGIGGSGPDHWQSHWQAANPGFRRFAPENWDRPDLGNWLQALDRMIRELPEPPVLIAHSLSCLLVAHSARLGIGRVRGAFLAAVPDPGSAQFPDAAYSFRDPPLNAFPFPSLVISSTDDPYSPVSFAYRCAAYWGSEFAGTGARGHINAASGLGAWPEGFLLFQHFCVRIGA